MPIPIANESVRDFDTYFDLETDNLRESFKTLFDNCRLLEARLKEAENRIQSLESDD
tara:strand:- start:1668 stop:1838 length:171 start_codon:yes stop_codon:yes gene_type:complete